ncbi:MAG: DUF481 domain-containing protein [Deltaproteobacteria bacterium]|nr:DUF481 domain-containing protein [Deltaproteobacteria bacterium]
MRARQITFGAVFCATFAASALGLAQPVTVANRNANQFEASAERTAAADEHRLRLQLGGAWIEGNARSLTANVAGQYGLRRGDNEFTASTAINLGFAVPPAMMGMTGVREYQRNTENYLARARYDRYFGDNSLWVSPLFFRDTFANVNSRLSGQFGYQRVFFNNPGKHKFRGEFGFDATLENLAFTTAVPARCPSGTMIPAAGMGACDAFAFMGRVYLGYENNLVSAFSLTAGLETLVNFLGLTTANVGPDIRVNSQLGASFKVGDFFSVGAQWNLRIMAQPIGTALPVDSNLLLTLNFSHSFDTPPPAAPEPEPAACPTCPTCPAAEAPTPPATEPAATTPVAAGTAPAAAPAAPAAPAPAAAATSASTTR